MIDSSLKITPPTLIGEVEIEAIGTITTIFRVIKLNNFILVILVILYVRTFLIYNYN